MRILIFKHLFLLLSLLKNAKYILLGEFGSTTTSALVPDVYVRRHNVSLLKALHICFGWQFYGIGILKFIADCSGFAGPLLLNKLVSFIENKSEDIGTGYLFALGLCLSTLIGKLLYCNYFEDIAF